MLCQFSVCSLWMIFNIVLNNLERTYTTLNQESRVTKVTDINWSIILVYKNTSTLIISRNRRLSGNWGNTRICHEHDSREVFRSYCTWAYGKLYIIVEQSELHDIQVVTFFLLYRVFQTAVKTTLLSRCDRLVSGQNQICNDIVHSMSGSMVEHIVNKIVSV